MAKRLSPADREREAIEYAQRRAYWARSAVRRTRERFEEMVALVHEMWPPEQQPKRRQSVLTPERLAVYRAVVRALRRGDLVKPAACGRCWTAGKVHAHHHDYAKPLDVVWLCPSCHGIEHARLERQAFVASLASERD